MGNDLSTSILLAPLSLNDCHIDGELDLMRYYIYKRKVRRKSIQSSALNAIINRKRKVKTDDVSLAPVLADETLYFQTDGARILAFR